MNRKLFVRITAIFLAVLMFGSVVMVAVQSFALGPDADVVIANTGDSNTKLIVTIVAVVAVVAIIGCVALPKLLKKK